jgi:hypothetical protein
MTSYINQTIARQQVAELIAQAERGRVRRQFRQPRRRARGVARVSNRQGPALRGTNLQWAGRLWVASAR